MRSSLRRGTRRIAKVAAIGTGSFVALVVIGLLIGVILDARRDRAEARLLTLEPVGSASFRDVFNYPDRYASQDEVWRLHGVIDSVQHVRGSADGNSEDSGFWSNTVISECWGADPCRYLHDDRARQRDLNLGFVEGPPSEFNEGDTVEVTCRIEGIRRPSGLGLGYENLVSIVADLCRDWKVIDQEP
jgi:hypothetical protein